MKPSDTVTVARQTFTVEALVQAGLQRLLHMNDVQASNEVGPLLQALHVEGAPEEANPDSVAIAVLKLSLHLPEEVDETEVVSAVDDIVAELAAFKADAVRVAADAAELEKYRAADKDGNGVDDKSEKKLKALQKKLDAAEAEIERLKVPAAPAETTDVPAV